MYSILIISVLISKVLASTNFTRRIFYNEDENVCNQRGQKVEILIKFDDGTPERTVFMIQPQPTYCDPHVLRYQSQIIVNPIPSFQVCEQFPSFYCQTGRFNQQKIVNSFFGVLKSIDARITSVRNPVLLNHEQFQCSIKGNEEAQPPPHFGRLPEYPYPIMQLYCSKIHYQSQKIQ